MSFKEICEEILNEKNNTQDILDWLDNLESSHTSNEWTNLMKIFKQHKEDFFGKDPMSKRLPKNKKLLKALTIAKKQGLDDE